MPLRKLTPAEAEALRQPTNITTHICIPDDQAWHLPKRRRAPHTLPLDVPVPRVGDVIYLSSTSAWLVNMRIYEWRGPQDLRIELWLEWVGSARHARIAGFALTQ